MKKQQPEKQTILLSAGGTGGHMTPAQALGRDLLSRGFHVELVTDQRGNRYAPMFEGIPIHIIRSGVMGAGIVGKIKGLASMLVGCLQAFKLIRKLRPALVVGFGGYPSFPAVYVAQKLHVPTILHEQNAIIGKANAFLAPNAERIAFSLPNLSGLDDSDKIRAVVTGNPVRAEIAALFNTPYPNLDETGEMRIFVMGGSLGASVFSKIVPATLARLSPDYKHRLHIVQQCREEDLEEVRKAYSESGIKADLASFFDDVPDQLAKAHLIIGRSGASTVAEIAASGRPAIFVPYPHHKDQQQKMNAEALADAGGAWVMSEEGFTEEALRTRLETFLQNPQNLFRAAENARKCGKPDAARKLGNLATAIARGWEE